MKSNENWSGKEEKNEHILPMLIANLVTADKNDYIFL